METADFANPDMDATMRDPAKLKPHTHHILVTGAAIHNDPTGDPINWMTSCAPTGFNPVIKGGFVIKGYAEIAGNGANAPFGNPNAVTICVLGGVSTGLAGSASVTYSNLTLTFAAPDATGGMNASSHFGTQAINGVVTGCTAARGEHGWGARSSACSVEVVPND